MSYSLSATAPKDKIREEIAAQRNEYLASNYPDGAPTGLLIHIESAIAKADRQINDLDAENVSVSISGHWDADAEIQSEASVSVTAAPKKSKT